MSREIHLEGRVHEQTKNNNIIRLYNNKSKNYKMRKTNNYETLLKNTNEYFELNFIVNEMFQKFVSCESSDGTLIRNKFEIFPLPFKHLTSEFLNIIWVALRAQMSNKFCLKRPF